VSERTYWRVPRDFVRVVGPDANAFLQGQLSQDVDAIEPGASARSFLLQPQGKVDAYLRVTRVSDDELVLDVDGGWGEAVIARLNRFKLRTKADIEPLDGWTCIATTDDDGALVERVGPGLEGDGVEGDVLGYESLRIRAGVPRMGSEIDETTIPASLGVVDQAVSFTKGCYTGQELVARIDSRGGHAPTKLVGYRGVAVAGDTVVVDGREVGRITSAGAGVALALVRRDVTVPAGPLEALPMA
jgi:folate-binding protein YgfZ